MHLMGVTAPRTRPLASALFLVSAAGLAFEIVLTRIFSLVLQYHYAFLAVSLAILGLALGAALAGWLLARDGAKPVDRGTPQTRARRDDSGRPYRDHRGKAATRKTTSLCHSEERSDEESLPLRQTRHSEARILRSLGLRPWSLRMTAQVSVLAALALAYPLSAVLLAWLPLGLPAPLRALVALPPYLLSGFFSALAFASAPGESGTLYAADLAGAAVGVAAGLGLISLWGAFSVAIALGVVVALAALLLTAPFSPTAATGRGVAASLFALLIPAGLLASNLALGHIDVGTLAGAPRDKTMAQVLADPAQAARIVYTDWDPFARVDVVETSDAAARLVFTDGGAGSYMLRFDGDLAPLAPLRDTVEYLPFRAGPAGRALVLGAGAGKDVLLALLAGSTSVTAVEVNPALVAATRRFAGYNGGILDRPEVRLAVGDARTFVERDAGDYDLIYLNLVYTQAAEPAGQALAESYLFTRQAFRRYLALLAPGGRLAIVSHHALEGSRAAFTGLAALQDAGVPLAEATRHLALLMLPADDPTVRQTALLVGKEPLSESALAALAEGSARLGLTPVFLPGTFEDSLAPLVQGMSLEAFVTADLTYDLRPVDDDRPFFFKLDPGLPAPVGQALLGAALLTAVLVAVAWRPARRSRWTAGLACVALIGAGYMLLEVPLIQRLQVLLGQPALATAVVLGGLLLGGGAGSLLSRRWAGASLAQRVAAAFLCAAVLGLAGWLALPQLVAALLAAGLAWRALAAGILAALLGLPLGVPFPGALRLAGERDQRAVPLLWSVNGAASALGSTLAVAVSMVWGFGWAMAAGAAAYLLAALSFRRLAGR